MCVRREYRPFYRALLQKRPIILRSLLIAGTPCLFMMCVCRDELYPGHKCVCAKNTYMCFKYVCVSYICVYICVLISKNMCSIYTHI